MYACIASCPLSPLFGMSTLSLVRLDMILPLLLILYLTPSTQANKKQQNAVKLELAKWSSSLRKNWLKVPTNISYIAVLSS